MVEHGVPAKGGNLEEPTDANRSNSLFHDTQVHQSVYLFVYPPPHHDLDLVIRGL